MRQNTQLYIDNMLVDLTDNISFPFTFQAKDFENPTLIKNSFTKTITIVGTKNNDKIFGEIYNFDRTQLYDEQKFSGAYFNPSIRTPFTLFNNGELVESGYIQLNSISIKDNTVNYHITMYGGIGDFLFIII